MEVISRKTEKSQCTIREKKPSEDYEWAIASAREEGRKVGLEEANLESKIQLLQDLLEEPVVNRRDLTLLTKPQLLQQLNELKQRFRKRKA